MAYGEKRGVDLGFYAEISSTQTLVGGLRNASISISGETINASHGGNYGWRRKLAGELEWSASASVVVLMEDANPWGFDPVVELMRSKQAAREEVPVEIRYPDESAHTGNAIVTTWEISGAYDGVLEGSFEVEGASALTWTINPAV